MCWLAVPKSLLEKPQQLSLLLVASPRKKALFWGSSRGYPPARQAAPPSMSAVFHMGCTEKGDKGEENASRQETPHYVPLQIEAFPVLPRWQMKLGGRTAVLPHALPVSRDKHLLTFCHQSECHVCPRANSPVLLQAPSPCAQAPCWPITGVRDGHVPPWAWRWLLRKQALPLLPSARCHNEGLARMAGASHGLHCPGLCSGSLLHCCWVLSKSAFPKAVLTRNEGQLDMAETTTRVCFPAPSIPSAPLGRGGSRAGFVPQHVSPAMAQNLAWPGSYWRAPNHPGSSRTAMHLGEHEKHLCSSVCAPVWVSLHAGRLLSPQTTAVSSGERWHMHNKGQAAHTGDQRSALYTPPLLASHQHYS